MATKTTTLKQQTFEWTCFCLTQFPLSYHAEFVTYTILQRKMVKPGTFKYAIKEVEKQDAEMFLPLWRTQKENVTH